MLLFPSFRSLTQRCIVETMRRNRRKFELYFEKPAGSAFPFHPVVDGENVTAEERRLVGTSQQEGGLATTDWGRNS